MWHLREEGFDDAGEYMQRPCPWYRVGCNPGPKEAGRLFIGMRIVFPITGMKGPVRGINADG